MHYAYYPGKHSISMVYVITKILVNYCIMLVNIYE